MQAELEALESALGHPTRPVAAVVGGAKVSSKLGLLGNLVGRVEMLVIGGAMANTFLAAEGYDVARSLQEVDLHATARRILEQAAAAGCAVLLPEDAVVASALKPGVPTQTVLVGTVPPESMILDVGPATVATVTARLREIRTVIWNGPLGAFETSPFDAGTTALARAVATATAAGTLRSVAGGGDTVAALKNAGVLEQISYISTAGGAFLEWMEGKTLPGIAALSR